MHYKDELAWTMSGDSGSIQYLRITSEMPTHGDLKSGEFFPSRDPKTPSHNQPIDFLLLTHSPPLPLCDKEICWKTGHLHVCLYPGDS